MRRNATKSFDECMIMSQILKFIRRSQITGLNTQKWANAKKIKEGIIKHKFAATVSVLIRACVPNNFKRISCVQSANLCLTSRPSKIRRNHCDPVALKKCSINNSYRGVEGLSSISQRFLIEISGFERCWWECSRWLFCFSFEFTNEWDHQRNGDGWKLKFQSWIIQLEGMSKNQT